ncbi:hypothetical protein BpHYR1_004061 [Brachionus plicatilis]|uniref:Secreted protein n=1 Tax=Brachionus plicatilis TaxID=10195 RepID=A0A3M7QYC9_BRAPC|nr:hypothetical protein BpHYR1_004061 [Brachionus plicatilis]
MPLVLCLAASLSVPAALNTELSRPPSKDIIVDLPTPVLPSTPITVVRKVEVFVEQLARTVHGGNGQSLLDRRVEQPNRLFGSGEWLLDCERLGSLLLIGRLENKPRQLRVEFGQALVEAGERLGLAHWLHVLVLGRLAHWSSVGVGPRLRQYGGTLEQQQIFMLGLV